MEQRVSVEPLGQGFQRVVAKYGYRQSPRVPEILRRARSLGLPDQARDHQLLRWPGDSPSPRTEPDGPVAKGALPAHLPECPGHPGLLRHPAGAGGRAGNADRPLGRSPLAFACRAVAFSGRHAALDLLAVLRPAGGGAGRRAGGHALRRRRSSTPSSNAQVKIPGPELVIITDGPDPERYALSRATVALDGKPLPGPVQPGWGKRFYEGPIAAGNHVLTAEFVYRGGRTGAYPWSDTYGFRVPGKVEFQAQRGLRLVVHLRVETHDEAEDAARQARLPGRARAGDDRQGRRHAAAAAAAAEGDARGAVPAARLTPAARDWSGDSAAAAPSKPKKKSRRRRPALPDVPAPPSMSPPPGCRRRSPRPRLRHPRNRAGKGRRAQAAARLEARVCRTRGRSTTETPETSRAPPDVLRGALGSFDDAMRPDYRRSAASFSRYFFIISSCSCFGTGAYLANSIVNLPLPCVAERRSVE